MSIQLRNSALLVLTSVIWGISFVVQSVGGNDVGPFTFNCIRLLLGALVVYLATLVLKKTNLTKKPENREAVKKQWIAGIVCGILLGFATNSQQLAIINTTTGKAGFLTATYILMVPIIGLFFKNKCPWNVWVSVAIALAGLYFLCINGAFRLDTYDILLLLCALLFAGQIIAIDKLGPEVDSLRMAAIEFLIAGIISLPLMIAVEIVPFEGGFAAFLGRFTNLNIWLNLAYMGFLSCGVAYTLQIVAQKGVNPTIASLLMSLEAVFSLLSGWVFLKQHLAGRELIGCGLMFVAICLSQISFAPKGKNSKF